MSFYSFIMGLIAAAAAGVAVYGGMSEMLIVAVCFTFTAVLSSLLPIGGLIDEVVLKKS